MRNLKRLSAFLLCLVLALMLAACEQTPAENSEPTPTRATSAEPEVDRSAQTYELYTEAKKKTASLTGSDITLSGTYTVSTAGSATMTNVEMNWQTMPTEDKTDKTAPDTSGTVIDVAYTDHLTASLSTGSNKTEYELYYDNGVMYREENGLKSRQSVARSTALKDTALCQILPLSEAAFESPILATVEGNTIVSLPLNGDMLSDALLSETGAPAYALGSLGDPSLYSFQNVTVKLTFRPDGYLIGYDLYYVMKVNDAARTTLTVSLAAAFNQPDKSVTITLPNLSDYEDASLQNDLNTEAYNAMPVIVDALFDADGHRVEKFDTVYASLCKTYTKAVVDTVISWFETQS